MRKKIKLILIALGVLLIGFALFRFLSVVWANGQDKVKICHSTGSESNPYVVNQPNKNGDVSGHDGHEDDIIPSFIYYEWECPADISAYTSHSHKDCKWAVKIHGDWHYADKVKITKNYPGKNWDEEGQAIWNNDCQIPEPSPTPTPTLEPTPTPQPICNDVCVGVEQCPQGLVCFYSWAEAETGVCRHPDCLEEEECDCPTKPTPTPTQEPEPTPTPTTPPVTTETTVSEPSTASAPMCNDVPPKEVANVYVWGGEPNDGCVEVRWIPAEGGSQAHIRYSEELGNWRYALLNTLNDGNEPICSLNNGVHYWFQVAGVNGCAVGEWSKAFDPLP